METMIDNVRNRHDLPAKILFLSFLYYYVFIYYIHGKLLIIPNIHHFVLIPISALAAFCFFFYIRKGLRISRMTVLWACYSGYMSLRYLLCRTEDMMALWACFTILIIISGSVELDKYLPSGIVLFFGYFLVAGQIIQIVAPSFYNTHIATLFINSGEMIGWSDYYGYTSFTHQVGTTSLYLIFSEGHCFAKAMDINSTLRTRVLYFIQMVVFIGAIILTGKRATFAISVIAPIIILCFDKRYRKIGLSILLASLVIAAVSVFLMYRFQGLFSGRKLFARLSDTVVNMFNGNDFSTGRTKLSSYAIQLFKQNPLFGSGLRTYKELTGAAFSPHNVYLETLCEQGIVGLAFLLTVMVSCIGKSIKLVNNHFLKYPSALTFIIFVFLEICFDSFVENSLSYNYEELIMFLVSIVALNSMVSSELEIK